MGKSYLYWLTILVIAFGTVCSFMIYLQCDTSLQAYLIALNITTFVYMGIDKRQAITAGARAPELLIYFLASLGGVPGLLMGCSIFKHKIRKSSFLLILFCIGLIQLILVEWTLEGTSPSKATKALATPLGNADFQ
mgnify:CR=1 FL=1